MAELLDNPGLGGFEHRHIRELSGGQQRGVPRAPFIAIPNPPFLDVNQLPGVDGCTVMRFVHLLTPSLHRNGTSVVLPLTHDINGLAAHHRVACVSRELIAGTDHGSPYQFSNALTERRGEFSNTACSLSPTARWESGWPVQTISSSSSSCGFMVATLAGNPAVSWASMSSCAALWATSVTGFRIPFSGGAAASCSSQRELLPRRWNVGSSLGTHDQPGCSPQRVGCRHFAIGVITTASFALGLALSNVFGQARRSIEAVLFGSILGVTMAVLAVACVGLLAVAIICAFYRKLLFRSV